MGVDGGGTKTEVVVTKENGQVVSRTLFGASNPNDIGKDNALALLKRIVKECTPKDAETIDVSMGIAGVAFAGCKTEFENALLSQEKVRTVVIVSDVDIALNSACEGDGAIVIMGTGSVALLRKDGRQVRVGGGGYMLDASLSGYDLGREALSAVLYEKDGRGEKTCLTGLVLSRFGKDVDLLVRETYEKGKTFVASFAPLVFEGYEKGDAVCENILRTCMTNFEKMLYGVVRHFDTLPVQITLFGGLTKRWDTLSRFLSKEILGKIEFLLPQNPVVYGALKTAKGRGNSSFLENFKQSYSA